MDILSLRKKLDNKEVTSEELFNNCVNSSNKINSEYNAFVSVMDEFKEEKSDSLLSGIPYVLKDNYSTSGILTTSSSNSLKDYIPVYDSTVYKKLKESGAVLVGKTAMDELAMGGSGTTANTGIVKNPYDKTRIIGGSSAGSACVMALDIVPFTLGSDTGDSVRKPAGNAGVVGFKPSYGRISRYGLFAFASSLDTVAYFTNTVKDAAIITDILKGKDKHDMTTLEDDNISYLSVIDDSIKGKKFFYIKEAVEKENYQYNEELFKHLDYFKETIEKIKSLGVTIEAVSIEKEILTALYPTYMSISCCEATSNYSNLNGIIYGPVSTGKDIYEIIKNYRTFSFNEMIKRRFILGSYCLLRENQEKLFLNAKRIRRLITDKINSYFQEYDALIMPISGSSPSKLDEKINVLSDEYLILENHLCIANFGGYPSISIPSGYINNLPVGINITCKRENDSLTLNIANKISEVLNFVKEVK